MLKHRPRPVDISSIRMTTLQRRSRVGTESRVKMAKSKKKPAAKEKRAVKKTPESEEKSERNQNPANSSDESQAPVSEQPTEAKSKQESWDICDDFLDPLANLLCETMEDVYYPEDRPPEYFLSAMDLYTGPSDYARELQNAVGKSRLRLAEAWLQVHVSFEAAEHVKNVILEAMSTVWDSAREQTWRDVSNAGFYLRDLSRVLRAKRERTPLRMRDLQEQRKRTPPMTLICLAEILNVGRNDVKSLILQEYCAEMQARGKWRIPVELMPPGWEDVFKKHRLKRQTHKKR
jgi:hypothetical protein